MRKAYLLKVITGQCISLKQQPCKNLCSSLKEDNGRLYANIKERGQLSNLEYCAKPALLENITHNTTDK